MATLAYTYDFATDVQGWSAQFGSSITWDGINGNPVGSLSFTIGPLGAVYWIVTKTWEQMGIPAGSIVTGIVFSVQEKTTTASGGLISYSWSTTAGNLSNFNSRSTSSVDSAWVSRFSGPTGVVSGKQASSSSIDINGTIGEQTGNSGASFAGNVDNISLSISYTPPAVPPHSDNLTISSGGLHHQNETLSSSGTLITYNYTGSATLVQSNETLNSQNITSHIFNGTCNLTHSNQFINPTLIRDATLDSYVIDTLEADLGFNTYINSNVFFVYSERYFGSAYLNKSGQTIYDTTTYTQPIYNGSASLTHSNFSANIRGTNSKGQYFGRANLAHHGMFMATQTILHTIPYKHLNLYIKGALPPTPVEKHASIPLFMYGDVTNQPHPHGGAGFIESSLNLYLAGNIQQSNNSGKLNLFIQGITSRLSNQITLYLCNNTNLLSGITTLFIRGAGLNPGFVPTGSSLNMFIEGTGSNIVIPGAVNNSIPLFVRGYISSANSVANATTLFVKVAENSSLNGNITLFIEGKNVGFVSNTITMVIPKTKLVNTIPLYIRGF